MRARSLKPEFFTDRKIAALGPVAALVYEALWVSADDGGTAPCDADRLKGQLFWAWSSVGVPEIAEALRALSESARILTYTVGDDAYCEIVHFAKHQSVHKPSTFRFPRPGSTEFSRDSGDSVEDSGTSDNTSSGDSGTPHHLYPKSCTPIHLDTCTPVSHGAPNGAGSGGGFAEIWSQYPKRSGGDSKHDALIQYNARLKAGSSHDAMLEGVKRYRTYCDATGKTGTEFVKQARTFLGRGMHFLEPWDVPAPKANGKRQPPGQYEYEATTQPVTVR